MVNDSLTVHEIYWWQLPQHLQLGRPDLQDDIIGVAFGQGNIPNLRRGRIDGLDGAALGGMAPGKTEMLRYAKHQSRIIIFMKSIGITIISHHGSAMISGY